MKILIIIGCLFFALSLNAQEVKWHTFEEAVEMNKNEARKIMVDVYTDWCGYCKIMDKNTFGNKIIAEYINKKYYPVKLNAEQKGDILFNEKTYKFIAQGTRGFHDALGTVGKPLVMELRNMHFTEVLHNLQFPLSGPTYENILFYRIPDMASVKIFYSSKTIIEAEIKICQYGALVPWSISK